MIASLSIPKALLRPVFFDSRGRIGRGYGCNIRKVWTAETRWLHSAALLLWCYMQKD
jgi:hypothetical protein